MYVANELSIHGFRLSLVFLDYIHHPQSYSPPLPLPPPLFISSASFSDLLITLLFWYFYIPYFANLWCSQLFRPSPPHLSFHRALLGLSNFKLRTRYYPPLEPRQDQAREPPLLNHTTPTHPARSSSSILLSHDDQECQLMCWHPNNHPPPCPPLLLLLLRWCSCWPQSVLLVHFSASHTTPHTGMYTTILCHTIRLIHSKPPTFVRLLLWYSYGSMTRPNSAGQSWWCIDRKGHSSFITSYDWMPASIPSGLHFHASASWHHGSPGQGQGQKIKHIHAHGSTPSAVSRSSQEFIC